MSDDITPALTPDEWARREVEYGKVGWIAAQGIVGLRADTFDAVPGSFDPLGSDTLYVGTYTKRGRASHFGIDLDPQRRHATAALCLDGQPYGFTRDDVTALRDAAGGHGEYMDPRALRSIADRLAALLPPESPP